MIEIMKHHSKPFTYIVSNGAIMIGELVEDDIANFLSKKDLKKFYSNRGNKFLVPVRAIRNIVKTPKIY
mgnify:CR=1 FL=1|jgi:hypothetical protein|tara:strand:+ start:811 stop:1017 length:207 start_codon:yes stop_codon:yes gene_type:complete